jgi:hypothetical protein
MAIFITRTALRTTSALRFWPWGPLGIVHEPFGKSVDLVSIGAKVSYFAVADILHRVVDPL